MTKKNSLMAEPNYYLTKHFPENLKAIEMRKIQIKMNKPVYWVFVILNLSKIQMWKL